MTKTTKAPAAASDARANFKRGAEKTRATAAKARDFALDGVAKLEGAYSASAADLALANRTLIEAAYEQAELAGEAYAKLADVTDLSGALTVHFEYVSARQKALAARASDYAGFVGSQLAKAVTAYQEQVDSATKRFAPAQS